MARLVRSKVVWSDIVAAWLPNARLAHGHRRLGGGPAGRRYFDEQLRSEGQREQLAAHELVGGLVRTQPSLSGDVVFGALCARQVEEVVTGHVLPRWQRGVSALRPIADQGVDPRVDA